MPSLWGGNGRKTMKVAVLQDKLNAALKQVKNIVDVKAKLPVLGCVWLRPADGAVIVDATDLDQSLSIRVGAKVDREGNGIVLNYAKLSKLIDRLSPERVDITVDYSTLTATFSCGSKTFELKGLDGDEFPQLPEIEEGLSIRPVLLLNALDQVSYAMYKGKDDRGALETVSFEYDGELFHLTAVDGFRLAITKMPCHDMIAPTRPFQALIPKASLSGLTDFLKASKDAMIFNCYYDESRRRLGFATTRATYWTTCSEYTFPNYAAIIPTLFDFELYVNREELLECAKSCLIYDKDMHFDWNAEKLNLAMSTGCMEMGEFRQNMTATGAWHGTFALDAQRLIDALSHMTCETVTVLVDNTPRIKIEGDYDALIFGKDLREWKGGKWW